MKIDSILDDPLVNSSNCHVPCWCGLCEPDEYYQCEGCLRGCSYCFGAVDDSKPWIVIEEFDSRLEAVEFCKITWDLKDGLYNMISQLGTDEFVVDTPNPNIGSTNNEFLEIEGFTHQSDALSFAQSCYQADPEGYISLISEV